MTNEAPLVGIIMGSRPIGRRCGMPPRRSIARRRLREKVVSAHRTPDRLYDYAKSAAARGFKVIIAGAGGAAHLPGMAAALTALPVLGVPVESRR